MTFTFQKLSRVSTKGALFVFETTNSKNMQIWYDAMRGLTPKSLFNLSTLQIWLPEIDFQVITCKGFLWIPYMLYWWISKPALIKFFGRIEGLMDNFVPPILVRSFYYRCVNSPKDENYENTKAD